MEKLARMEIMIPGEPELVSKNIPKPHIHKLRYGGFEAVKRRAKQCPRCGEMFVTDLNTQSYCNTCRGEMGWLNMTNFDTWPHGIQVTQMLEDLRR